ncbi:hypothetical protein Tco_0463481, partial [Tanacetum coccineum]
MVLLVVILSAGRLVSAGRTMVLLVAIFSAGRLVSAGPSVAADKGKAPVPDFEIPAEFLAEDAQARKRFEEEQASERLV